MAKIYEDEFGLYTKVGGYIARPENVTMFNRGDITEGKHFSGSTLVGMGKLPKRGRYKEYWTTEQNNIHVNPDNILKTVQSKYNELGWKKYERKN